MAPRNKAAEIDNNSASSKQRETKEGATEIKPNDKTYMENTTENPDDTGEALKISVVEKAQNTTTKPNPVIHSSFDDPLGQKLPAGYTELLMEINEVSRSRLQGCQHPPCSRVSTADAKHDQTASFLRASLVSKNNEENVVLPEEFALFLHDMVRMYKTENALNEKGILTSEKEV